MTIFIVGLLCALLLPAVQVAREAARRAACTNNLRQLALGALNYHEVVASFPMGTPFYAYPSLGPHVGHSLLVAMLPQLDEVSLFNSVNFRQNIYQHANQTVHATSVASFQCPSDPLVSGTFPFSNAYLDIPAGQFAAAFASYSGCAGTWYHLDPSVQGPGQYAGTDNGIFFVNSAIRAADIVDGSSNTLMFGEHARKAGQAEIGPDFYWWFDGFFGDTIFITMYPIGYWGADMAGGGEAGYLPMTARSLHPGGANFAMADGSVRFIKSTIQSWPVDPQTGNPEYVRGSPKSPFIIYPGTTVGVYQALSTRNGHEVVGRDF